MTIYSKILVFFFITIFMVMLYVHASYGIDLSDEGYLLSKAWSIINYDFAGQLNNFWGTTLINGLWLNIFSVPSLFWARLGQVIVLIGISFYSWRYLYSILCGIKNKNNDALELSLTIILSISVMIIPISLRVINYNSFPYFILLIAIFYFRTSLESGKINYLTLVLSSIGFGILPFFKSTYISAWILPVLLLFNFKKSKRIIKFHKIFLTVLLSLICSFGIVILLLYLNEVIQNYSGIINSGIKTLNANENFLNSHSYGNLINLYWLNILSIMKYMLFMAIVDLGMIYSQKKLYRFYTGIYRKYSESFMLTAAVFILFFILKSDWENWHLWICAAIIYFPVRNVFYLKKDMRLNYLFEVLILWIIFIVSFIGSDSGIYTAVFSMSPVLSASFIILSSYYTQQDNEESFYLVNKKSFLFVFLIVFTGFGFFLKNELNYRDIRFTEINSSFKSKELLFVRSSCVKTESLDEVMEFFDKRKNTKPVFLNSIPIFYYLTDKPFILHTPWDTFLNEEEYKKFIETADYDIAVVAYKDPRNKNWPKNESLCWPKDFKKIQFLFEYLNNSNKFRLVLQNEMFLIFERIEQ